MIISVTGTPGTGKTFVGKRLAKRLGYRYVDVKKMIEANNIADGFDSKRRCLIIDPKKMRELIMGLVPPSEDAIIDSHMSHLLPIGYAKRCIVTTCGLKVLEKRLAKRGYPKSKIRDNLDAEIFEVCRCEAEDNGHKSVEADTTKGCDIDSLIKRMRLKRAK